MDTAPLCSNCVSGAIHSGTPSGTEEIIHGLKTYVARPDDGILPKALIVMIPDAFGWTMVNNRLLCDRYAKKGGFLLYLPDFMNGAALPASFLKLDAQMRSKKPWSPAKLPLLLKASTLALPQLVYLRPGLCRPRIISFLQSIRASPAPFSTPESGLKIGIAGFCWGGSFTMQLAQDLVDTRVQRHVTQVANHDGDADEVKTMRLIDCAFTAHPALVKIPKDIEEVVLPLSVCIGVEDEWMKGSDVAIMKKGLDEKAGVEGFEECECVLLEGAKHGFAVRSWEDDSVQMGFADVAEKQALEWFRRWLS